jgi:hypothetical protein
MKLWIPIPAGSGSAQVSHMTIISKPGGPLRDLQKGVETSTGFAFMRSHPKSKKLTMVSISASVQP